MTIRHICVREVDVATPDESVMAAARRMQSRKVGTLVVVNADNEPVGLVTDRDLAVRVLAAPLDPVSTSIYQVMTTTPRTINEDTSFKTALRLMREGRFRRLPVVGADEKLVGLVSLDDILEVLGKELREVGRLLADESPRSLAQT